MGSSSERRRSSERSGETDVVRESGNKRHSVEIQVSHVGADLQFQSAEVGPAAATPAEEKHNA